MKTLNMPLLKFELPPIWRLPAFVTLLMLAALMWLYRGTGAAMVEIWDRTGDYSHCWVVFPMALWLVWRLRRELAAQTPKPQLWVLAPIALTVGVWWLSELVSTNLGSQLAFVALLVLMVPLLLGLRVTWVLAFPLFFLFFAVPAGDFMTPYLMRWTAKFVVIFLRLTGIPVYTEGQHLVIPSGRWAVVEACGGIRYLMSTLMVGSLFAYLNFRSTQRRVMFMLLSFVVPVVANWLRAYLIVMIGHLSDNRLATGVDHLFYGWVFFGVVVFALFVLGARFAESSDADDVPPAATAVSPPGHIPWQLGAALVLGLLTVQWPLLLQPRGAAAQTSAAPVLRAPNAAGDWLPAAQPSLAFLPDFKQAAATINQAYAGRRGEVILNLQYYRGQTQASKLITSQNILIDSYSQSWNTISHGQAALPGQPEAVWNTQFVVDTEVAGDLSTRKAFSIWQTYWIGGHLTSNALVAKLWQVWLALTLQPDDAAAIIVWAPAAEQGDGDARLVNFLRDNFDVILRGLQQTRDTR
jgi:exosortase A